MSCSYEFNTNWIYCMSSGKGTTQLSLTWRYLRLWNMAIILWVVSFVFSRLSLCLRELFFYIWDMSYRRLWIICNLRWKFLMCLLDKSLYLVLLWVPFTNIIKPLGLKNQGRSSQLLHDTFSKYPSVVVISPTLPIFLNLVFEAFIALRLQPEQVPLYRDIIDILVCCTENSKTCPCVMSRTFSMYEVFCLNYFVQYM